MGEEITINATTEILGVYQFDTKVAKHCHYPVNLGCIDEVDVLSLAFDVFDGKSI